MSADIIQIGSQKVKSVKNGEVVELKTFWENQSVAIIFFRRWGCMFCRLWATELSEIAPVLQKNNIKLIGVGVDEIGAEEFANRNFFDGDLYYVEKISTYKTLGFKRFNVASILASLLWKQSREALNKGRSMGISTDVLGDGLQNGGLIVVKNGGKLTLHFCQSGPADHLPNVKLIKCSLFSNVDLGGDSKGDWGQVGGAVLVQKGGNLLRHFAQTGPAEHLSNRDILKIINFDAHGRYSKFLHFNLEHEYVAETMANKDRDGSCPTETRS